MDTTQLNSPLISTIGWMMPIDKHLFGGMKPATSGDFGQWNFTPSRGHGDTVLKDCSLAMGFHQLQPGIPFAMPQLPPSVVLEVQAAFEQRKKEAEAGFVSRVLKGIRWFNRRIWNLEQHLLASWSQDGFQQTSLVHGANQFHHPFLDLGLPKTRASQNLVVYHHQYPTENHHKNWGSSPYFTWMF